VTAEVTEAEVREVTEPRALVVSAPQTQVILGSAALALMSPDEFDANLKALELARERADRIKRALMAEGTDYGTVPGVTKAFLWKSGAETLDKAFGLVASFDVRRVVGDGVTEPPYSFHAHALIHLGSTDGPVVGEGFGTCNPWETRYRYRNGERTCPNCGKAAVIKGKAEYGGGWLCWTRKDGCGSKWRDGDPAIEGQVVGQIENENPWDLENTIAKMAEKRAHVDGSIRATGTSGLFTQDDDSPAVQPHTDSPSSTPAARDSSSPAAGDLSPFLGDEQGPWEGEATTGQPPTDGSLRQTPDGPVFGFVVMEPVEGKANPRKLQVIAKGDLAHALDLAWKAGKPDHAKVWGDMWMVPWEKDGSRKPPYRRIEATRVMTPDWTLPATDGPAIAPPASDKPDDDMDNLPW
jgi:hypothetical protein